MKIVTETITRTYCECGEELHSAEDWSKHKSRHTIEWWCATPERKRTMDLVMGDYQLHRPQSRRNEQS